MIDEPVDCQTLVELVTDWMEHALPEPTRSDLEIHLATCAGCIAYVEQLRTTRALLAGLDEPDEPDEPDEFSEPEQRRAPTPPEADRSRAQLLAAFRAQRVNPG